MKSKHGIKYTLEWYVPGMVLDAQERLIVGTCCRCNKSFKAGIVTFAELTAAGYIDGVRLLRDTRWGQDIQSQFRYTNCTPKKP